MQLPLLQKGWRVHRHPGPTWNWGCWGRTWARGGELWNHAKSAQIKLVLLDCASANSICFVAQFASILASSLSLSPSPSQKFLQLRNCLSTQCVPGTSGSLLRPCPLHPTVPAVWLCMFSNVKCQQWEKNAVTPHDCKCNPYQKRFHLIIFNIQYLISFRATKGNAREFQFFNVLCRRSIPTSCCRWNVDRQTNNCRIRNPPVASRSSDKMWQDTCQKYFKYLQKTCCIMISVMVRRYCVKFSQNNSDPVNWWGRVGIVSIFSETCVFFFIFLDIFFSAFFFYVFVFHFLIINQLIVRILQHVFEYYNICFIYIIYITINKFE